MTESDSKRLDEIRERRAKITAPPWTSLGRAKKNGLTGCVRSLDNENQSGNLATCQTWPNHNAKVNAQFIASSPSDIDYLLDLVSRIEAETIERCAKEVRAKCSACAGSGVGGCTGPEDDPQPYECEYCGRPMSAIRSLQGVQA